MKKRSFISSISIVGFILLVGVLVTLLPVGGLKVIYLLAPNLATFEKVGIWFLWGFAIVVIMLGLALPTILRSKEKEEE